MVSIKKIGLFILFPFVTCLGQATNQDESDMKDRIATWFRDKPGAISITFDDQDYTQYSSAYPILEKYGIKGTFSIIGEWTEEEPSFKSESGFFEMKRMGWAQLLELHQQGHELAAHGFLHQKYDKFRPAVELAEEMQQIKSLIESRISGRVYTIHYPYSYASENIPVAAKQAGFLFGRSGLDTLNLPDPPDMLLLASRAVINDRLPDSALFQQWIREARNNWLILMYHHFFEAFSKENSLFQLHNIENTYSILPDEFEQQVASLASSGYWIAPVREIGKYVIQRENTGLRTIRAKKKITLYTITNLDRNIYDHPLTLIISVPWKKATVTGSLEDGDYIVTDHRLIINAMPEQEVTIIKGWK